MSREILVEAFWGEAEVSSAPGVAKGFGNRLVFRVVISDELVVSEVSPLLETRPGAQRLDHLQAPGGKVIFVCKSEQNGKCRLWDSCRQGRELVAARLSEFPNTQAEFLRATKWPLDL